MPKSERFEMRVSPKILEILDELCKREPDEPTRAEMIRRLIVEKWKKTQK